MEQRPLRLGDTVDDYCPRERRVTNHVIVAIVEDAIRQTRCTTCDADHSFKGVRESRRKRKDDGTLVDSGPGQLIPPKPGGASPPGPTQTMAAAPASTPGSNGHDANHADSEVDGNVDGNNGSADHPGDRWISHRQLIRASLPRTEGELPPPRPIPEFTMHQRPMHRGGHGGYRGHGWSGSGAGNGGANGNANGNVNGNVRHPQGQGRSQGPGPGGPGPASGPGQGHGPRRHRGGKHRRPR